MFLRRARPLNYDPTVSPKNRMRLIESDPSLAAVCRLVEVRLGQISTLAAVEIPVVLLADFSQLGPPVTARDPTAYNRSEKRIFVNARVFPSFREDAAHFALAHEIGHHAHDTGISGVLLARNACTRASLLTGLRRSGASRKRCEGNDWQIEVQSIVTNCRASQPKRTSFCGRLGGSQDIAWQNFSVGT
jgi:hypothetical protein